MTEDHVYLKTRGNLMKFNSLFYFWSYCDPNLSVFLLKVPDAGLVPLLQLNLEALLNHLVEAPEGGNIGQPPHNDLTTSIIESLL